MMLTGTALINELVDELNELKLSTMAATLDDLYHKPGFLEMDRLTLIAELIGPQFQEKVSTTLKNRLTAAHLKGSPEELSDCVDSDKREYLPAGITEVLSSFDFIERGYNVCILGESDSGKSYLAKAIGIKACNRYNVGYFHSEELLESMVALKEQDYDKYARKMKKYLKWELIILDEPTAGQDFRHYTEIMEFLRGLNEKGVTVVMITHDMHLMLEYTPRALVFADGRLIADRSAAAVLCDPQLIRQAALKETSLFTLANQLGISPAEEFVQRFIEEDREVRSHGR